MSRPTYVVWSCALALFFQTSLNALETHSDRAQRQINAEAFKNRFQKDAVVEEETGVRFTEKSLSSEESEAFDIQNWRNPNWKMILMTGDDSITAFDNARKKVFSQLTEYGIDEGIQLSRSPNQQVNGVRATSIANLEQAAKDLKIQDGDGCLVFITSHGSPAGFYIRGQNPLTPTKFNQILASTCGKRPTVILVSACYSGIFAEPLMEAPNRIILTAARKDKTSFGCSAEAQYTYWDGCLVESLPKSKTWAELSQVVEKCIQRKETGGGFSHSYPQARIGSEVKDLEIKQ